MKAEIVEMARKLLPEGFDEEELSFRAADVEAYICGYCHVEEVPQGCETLAARMIAAAADGPMGGRGLKSVTRGDFSASYYEAGSQEGMENFDRRLNAFRRLNWRRS